jgi:hypothetical protein
MVKTIAILRRTFSFFLLSSFLFSCATPESDTQTQIITINYSPFVEFQMDEVYACANDLSIVLKVSAENPEIYFQIGEPETLYSFVYQIDEEEIVVAVNRQSNIQNLVLEDVQNLFAGAETQAWVYPSDSDMQNLFDQFVIQGRSVSSFAKIAPSLQVMVEALSSESNSIGYIPKSEMIESLREIYSVGTFPILALTDVEPQEAVKNLLGCLQEN